MSLREQLQQTLGDAYVLEQELGGGGMSRVFVATETALGRRVVVKVLPGEMAGQLSVDRFKREISIAARLQHAHIFPLLAAGEVGGLPYFTMPFVEGESLRARLARQGELPLADAIRMLREIASALSYAHSHDVVHRDIKPDNVLLSGGAGITSVGMALGTPAYMAPEQATADPLTDHRADLYAWGMMAYELITGQSPFAGRSPQAMLAAQVTETPEHITRRRAAISPALANIVMRCLEKRGGGGAPTAAIEMTLAVLPIENLGGDSATQYLADGMTGELSSALTKMPGLQVVGDLSTFRFKGTHTAPAEIARQLGVRMLLTGRLQPGLGRVRLQMQLSKADGKLLWSNTFDRDNKDNFAMQDEITGAIAAEMRMVLSPMTLAVTRAGRTVNPEALNPNSPDGLFMVSLFSYLTGDNHKAIALADRLIQLDPLSPLAARLRAEALMWGGRNEEALQQHLIANKLDPTVIISEATDGNALRELGRLDESVAAFLAFEKTFDQPSWGLAVTLGRMGKRDDAMRVIRTLEERERKQWVDPNFIAIAYAGIGDRDHAMEWLEKAFRIKTFSLRAILNWDDPWLRSMHDDPRFIALKKRALATTFKS